MQWSGFSDTQMDKFRSRQRLSFAIQAQVTGGLTDGDTERDATTRMLDAYRSEGVTSFFHLPVALFGDRTTLPDPWDTLQFWPSDRVLEPGDAVVLDASPIFDGYLVDTSTSRLHGEGSGAYDRAAEDDLAYRGTILDAIAGGATFREIAIAVDESFAAAGYRNCHRLHPGEVLGHRVGHVADAAEPDEHGFAHGLIAWFVDRVGDTVPSPTWSDGPGSDHPPADGLWAVEPHLATGAIGVKWEEILVIDHGEAHWLDSSHLGS
jgi:Xaa-Pro aminopeptidase